MKVVVQRVKECRVKVEGDLISEIQKGLLLLVGIEKGDEQREILKIADKISKLRIFEDGNGKMNLNIKQSGGELMSVSQFTLLGDTNKGNRPGFDAAELPQKAETLWHCFNKHLATLDIKVREGSFGKHMQVELVNDGPVTFVLESQSIVH